MAIDFTLSESQQELQKNAKAFAEGVLRPVAGLIDRAADGWSHSWPAGGLPRNGHAGFTKSYIPAEYGGAGFSMLDLAIAAPRNSPASTSTCRRRCWAPGWACSR